MIPRLLFLSLAFTLPAFAQASCPTAGTKFVTLSLSEATPPDQAREAEADRELLGAVRALLQAQLTRRRLQVCLAAQSDAQPLARVVLSLERASSSRVETAQIRIADSSAGEGAFRQVELAGTPADSVPLTLAVSIDELLRARLADLSPLPDPAARPAPKVPSQPAAKGWDFSLKAAALAESDSSSSVRLGAGGSLQLALGSGFIGLGGGYLHALSRPAPHGRVLDFSVLGVVDGGAALTSRSAPAGLELAAWLSLARTTAYGIPIDDAQGKTRAFAWWGVGGELLGWVRLGARLQLISSVSVGAPLRAADALDGEQRLPLLAGPLALGRLGLRWKLR